MQVAIWLVGTVPGFAARRAVVVPDAIQPAAVDCVRERPVSLMIQRWRSERQVSSQAAARSRLAAGRSYLRNVCLFVMVLVLYSR